ncbi:MAG TPA: hypothetical protein DIU35_15115 [Candidatus Latescibacteria bacterium]|nr:hypothetical protein [Gemmatimonadota bacterium]HCR18809.1 hypothetical protein [Candidatus Latescibacterota bacterium]
MAYTDTGGNGVPLVFLHGTGCDDVYWAGICGLLCSRLKGRCLVAFLGVPVGFLPFCLFFDLS